MALRDKPYATYEALVPIPELKMDTGDVILINDDPDEDGGPISVTMLVPKELHPRVLRLVEDSRATRALTVTDPPPEILARGRICVLR